MSATKVVLIVLVLIVVLFVVLAVRGAGTNRKPFDPFKLDQFSKLGDLFGPPGPKLRPSELTPHPLPLRRLHPAPEVAPDKFILSAGDMPTMFDVAPDSKHQFRQATFVINRFVDSQSCAKIVYQSADGRNEQTWPSEKVEHPKNPKKVTFHILGPGGSLTFTLPPPDCTVQLE